MPLCLHLSTSRLHWPGPGRVRVLSLPLHPAVILSSSSCVCVRLALALASSGVPPWHVVFVSSPLLLSSDFPRPLPFPSLRSSFCLSVLSTLLIIRDYVSFDTCMHASVSSSLPIPPPSPVRFTPSPARLSRFLCPCALHPVLGPLRSSPPASHAVSVSLSVLVFLFVLCITYRNRTL